MTQLANVTQLKDKQGNVVSPGLIEDFSARLRGEVVLPSDDAYESCRRIWNASIDKYPGIIVQCVGTGDVVDAVYFARENDLLVAVRGGGHNVGGRALCDDGMVIDLSLMRGVQVDVNARVAHVQGGAKLGDIDKETHLHGLAVPVGVISDTGVAGLTLGGGVGWLVQKYGLTIDNVRSFEVVTADGKLLRASANEHPDLFWALRGGGGNFGVVTSFEFLLRPVETVLGGMILFPRERAGEVLRFYRDFVPSAPEELTAYAGLLCAPDGTPAVAVIVCYCGDLARGEKAVQPLRDLGSPILDTISPIPFPQMQSMLDGGFPEGTQNYWKGLFAHECPDQAIDAMVEHANRAGSPLTSILIEYYGGAASRVGPGETAFAHREAMFDIAILTQWQDPAESDDHQAWTRFLAKALEPSSNGRYLLNTLDRDDNDRIRAAFGENYDRLVEVKHRYDPTNFLAVNYNIPPSDR